MSYIVILMSFQTIYSINYDITKRLILFPREIVLFSLESQCLGKETKLFPSRADIKCILS
jgi:hypothetical protein